MTKSDLKTDAQFANTLVKGSNVPRWLALAMIDAGNVSNPRVIDGKLVITAHDGDIESGGGAPIGDFQITALPI